MSEPISEIRLPAHHPAVAECGDGDCVNIKAKKVKDSEHKMPMGMRDSGEEAPPLEHRFHVMSIHKGGKMADDDGDNDTESPAEERAEAKPKKGGPIEKVKARRGY